MKWKMKKLLFYLSIVIIPIVQVCVFYVYVNVSFFANAFTRFDLESGKYVWNGLNNFAKVVESFKTNNAYIAAIWNSLLATGVGVATQILILMLSFYIQQRFFGSKVFLFILFLPTIISTIALSMVWQNLLVWVFPAWGLPDYFNNLSTAFASILVFGLWAGLGGNIFIYISAMNNVSPSVLESARLDGLGFLGEFFYIVIPGIFKSISIYLIGCLMGFFTSQSGYNFYADDAPAETYTIGYIVFVNQLKSKNMVDFPYACAFGLFSSFFAVPTILIARKLFDKFGPSED